MNRRSVLILDFGSQFTQLIARRIRELSVFCEVEPFGIPLEEIRRRDPLAIILSGGPDSVYRPGAPSADRELFETGAPVLGICYGMQLMMHVLGGKVVASPEHEYGPAELFGTAPSALFEGLPERQRIWASHGDRVAELAPGFVRVASTSNAPEAAVEDPARKLYGILFHPEVAHTEHGSRILKNFLFGICGAKPDWTMGRYMEEAIARIREDVGDGKVVCALSGGVDSSVMALLVHRAIGDRLVCLFVDTGAMRKNETEEVENRFRSRFHLDVRVLRYGDLFLQRLKGVVDPEHKRKIVGETFIHLFEDQASRLGGIEFLAQGTIYPDRIESKSVRGPSAVIKTHHNVGGLPERMKLKLIEPLKDLFKDEVRALGRELGLDQEFLERHPFPGPGLVVRILGEVTAERIQVLQEADAVFIEEIRKAGLYSKIAQAFAVLLPVRSVGVMGDGRTYDNVLALRAVETTDFMTADWSPLPYDLLARISSRIVNEVRGVNRVVYDISSKPPATIEWE
jgi:GMP synthase (glutamine-hydrolysing)